MILPVVFFALAVAPQPQKDSASAPSDWAWSILHDGLDNKSADKRAKAIHALSLMTGSRQAEEIGCKALSDPNADVRIEAATSLAEIGVPSARANLRALLADQDVRVVIAAANALYKLKDPAAFDVYYELLTGDMKSTGGRVQTQLNTLKNRKAMEKLAFETGIGFVPFGGMGWEAWRTVTTDDSSPIRAAAAEKLARDPDPMTADALASACSDKNWRVRAAAVNAIAKRGQPGLAKSLRPLLFDGNDTVRYDAAAAILHLAGAQIRNGSS